MEKNKLGHIFVEIIIIIIIIPTTLMSLPSEYLIKDKKSFSQKTKFIESYAEITTGNETATEELNKARKFKNISYVMNVISWYYLSAAVIEGTNEYYASLGFFALGTLSDYVSSKHVSHAINTYNQSLQSKGISDYSDYGIDYTVGDDGNLALLFLAGTAFFHVSKEPLLLAMWYSYAFGGIVYGNYNSNNEQEDIKEWSFILGPATIYNVFAPKKRRTVFAANIALIATGYYAHKWWFKEEEKAQTSLQFHPMITKDRVTLAITKQF